MKLGKKICNLILIVVFFINLFPHASFAGVVNDGVDGGYGAVKPIEEPEHDEELPSEKPTPIEKPAPDEDLASEETPSEDSALVEDSVPVEDSVATEESAPVEELPAEDLFDDIPKTGDRDLLRVWWVVCGVSALTIGVLIVIRKKEFLNL